jgi:UDP-2,3-diacylglucosamine hydrolase
VGALFLSDLHLGPEQPQLTAAFRHYLETLAQQPHALYILGDLFDRWIGDDDDAPWIAPIADALRVLSDAGTALFLMHGNRDFLLGRTFCERIGAELIPDPCVPLSLSGWRLLLTHGDALCTDDRAYQAYRRQVRDPDWQRGVLSLSLSQRRTLAAELREASDTASAGKSTAIMDVAPTAVASIARAYLPDAIIHGHTHRPGRVDAAGEVACPRYVLGDWRPLASGTEAVVLHVDENKIELEKILINNQL